MLRIVALGAAGVAVLLSMGVTQPTGLEERLALLEDAARRRKPTIERAEIDRLEAHVATLAADEEICALEEQIAVLQTELAAAKEVLSSQRAALDSIERVARKAERIDDLEAGIDVRWDGLVRALDATTSLVDETRDELGRVQRRLDPGVDELWERTVGPTVQLKGLATVGSGVLLPSQPLEEDPTRYRTLLLTSWHVVRDIRADSIEEDDPVPVFVRDRSGQRRRFTATLLDHDVPLDTALLVLNSVESFAAGATLPSRTRLDATRVFDPIVAVGCPLGNDPIPTRGHLSDLHHSVGRERFWMISAPTYIGNSGGGIYSEGSHELLGIFSKIYTHGSIRPTVIPHMGLVTPLAEFYDWIDRSGIARIVEDGDSATIDLLEDAPVPRTARAR
ncbi:MAG: trypsin-like peptidase domain-containing protein [Planctomycetota bacterium]